jgi:hypothetical protein
MDNASNNDTLMRAIEKRCADVKPAKVDFSAADSRMRCMPHTVHLAAIKVLSIYYLNHLKLMFIQLLEGIGALSKADTKKALSRSGNYQDNTVAPMDREHDNEVVQLDDEEEHEDQDPSSDNSDTIISAIAKVISMAFLAYTSMPAILIIINAATEDCSARPVKPPTTPKMVQGNICYNESGRCGHGHR